MLETFCLNSKSWNLNYVLNIVLKYKDKLSKQYLFVCLKYDTKHL